MPFDAGEVAMAAKAASGPDEAALSFVILPSFDELRALPDAQPEMVAAPWLPLSGLAMVYAWRGTGKSQFILGLAISIATGTDFLKWQVPKARSVAYIDGELPVADLLSRFDRLIAPSGIKPADGQLRLLSMRHPEQRNQLNLADRRHHAPLLAAIGDAEVVILDSTVSLWDGKEADAWPVVKAFLKQLMQLGKTPIFLHQAGKSGEQRGLSDYEDLPHTVIQLFALPKRPDGMAFRVIFDKTRSFFGADADPINVTLTADGWSWSAVKGAPAIQDGDATGLLPKRATDASRAMLLLRARIETSGKSVPDGIGAPTGTTGIREDEFRAAYSLARPGANPAACRQGYGRTMKAMEANSGVRRAGDWVWIDPA